MKLRSKQLSVLPRPKNFGEVMGNAGYATTRADNPSFVPERVEDGLGSGYSSESPGSDQGPSCKFQDDVNGKTLRDGLPQPKKSNNNINNPIPKKPEVNPFTGLDLPSVDTQATF